MSHCATAITTEGERARHSILARSSTPHALVAVALLLGIASDGRAQCPDGSPAPCGGPPPYVSGATRRLPDSVRVLYNRAVAEGRRRTHPAARESFSLLSRVIAFDSNFAPAWSALSEVSQQSWLRRWDVGGADRDSLLSLAVSASRRAVQLDSNLASAWVVYARAAGSVDVTERRASRNALSRALAIDPQNADALFALALMEEELLRPSAAERAYKRALAVSPTHLESLTFLALHYFWRSQYALARRLSDSALALDPTYSVAREAAAEIALVQRRWEDAERHATILRTTQSTQEPILVLTYLARAAAGRGTAAAGVRYLQEGERSVPLDEASRHTAVFMGSAWAQLGDTARALDWLRAYRPRNDVHFQLHLKREPGLRWLLSADSTLLTPPPSGADAPSKPE